MPTLIYAFFIGPTGRVIHVSILAEESTPGTPPTFHLAGSKEAYQSFSALLDAYVAPTETTVDMCWIL